MKDYADKTWLTKPPGPESNEKKLVRAKALLDQLGINRANVNCKHVYVSGRSAILRGEKK